MARPTLARLWAESIEPPDDDLRAAFDLVIRHVREPVLSYAWKAQLQGLEGEVMLSLDEFAPYCTFFPWDIEICTGYQVDPTAGYGSHVALSRAPDGGWEIAHVSDWIS